MARARNIEELPTLNDERAAYQWVKKKGLLKENLVCESCNVLLKLPQHEANYVKEYRVCAQNQCEKYLQLINSLEGSFFKYCKNYPCLSCQIHLIKYFCDKIPYDGAIAIFDQYNNNFSTFNKECLEFITRYFQKYPIKLGGESIVVAVKINQLDVTDPTRKNWFLMMVDTSKRPLNGFMKDLNSVNFDDVLPSILPIIETVAIPGSIIAFDLWESLPQVCSRRFGILGDTVSQSDYLSSYYDSHDETYKKINTTDLKLDLCFNEGMWRERYQADAFNKFIDQLRIIYN